MIQTSEGNTNSEESGERKSHSGVQGRNPVGGMGDSLMICEKGGAMASAQRGSGAELPAWSMGRAPGQGVKWTKLKAF